MFFIDKDVEDKTKPRLPVKIFFFFTQTVLVNIFFVSSPSN